MIRWLAGLLLLFCIHTRTAADTYTLIVCGTGGEETYTETFTTWGTRLRAALIDRCEFDPDKIVLLTEKNDTPEATAPSTRESILSRLRELGVRSGRADQLLVFLIGHGSYRHREAKLNIAGPDLSAEDLAITLQEIRAGRTIVINTASTSAPFLNALSTKGRIICTSTRTRDQVNATHYAEFFIQTLEDGSADLNRDDRISVWEASKQAATLTAAYYADQKLVASENAILDDNGDGKGTRLHADEIVKVPKRDGDLARRTYLKDIRFPDHIPEEWVSEYRAAIARVEAWVARKSAMDSAKYVERLEELLLEAARKNKKIREVGSRQ
jgi:hypothetical protein